MRSTGGIGQHAAVRAHESSGLLHPAVSAIRSTERWHSQTVARAEKVACSPSDDRCYSLPYPLEEVRASCSPKGRCRIGGTRRVIVANAGRDSWDVWLDVHTGEGRLRRQTQSGGRDRRLFRERVSVATL